MNRDSHPAIVDLSHAIDATTPPFPGDPAVEVHIFDATENPPKGGRGICNSSAFRTSLHCGTHMDAPFHFFGDGDTIDRVPLDACTGSTLVLRLPGSIESGVITPEDLAPFAEEIHATRRVIFDTGWHLRWRSEDYFTAHPVLSTDAAWYLVDKEVCLVGVDFPSVDHPPYETHRALLGSGIVILENLTNLGAIPEDIIRLAAFPLRLRGRDGSPVRAVAIIEP